MQADRRSFFSGALAACVVAGKAGAAADGAATRRFDLFRAGAGIGRQTVTVARNGSRVTVDVDVDIAVRVIGVPVYRYALTSREVWDGGRLAELEASTDDNGSRQFARATRGPDGLRVEGAAFSGVVGGNPGTTTYWAPAFLKRPVWISTQDGRPLSVSARSGAVESFPAPGGTIAATRWRIGGDLEDLDLFYDRTGEWVGSEFPAEGETVRVAARDARPALTPLWVDAS